MKFRDGLLAARGHIVFLLGLLVAFSIIFALESWDPDPQAAEAPAIAPSPEIPEPSHAPLTADEVQAAETAWAYFDQNIRPETDRKSVV